MNSKELENNVLIKPEFKSDIKAEITGIQKIEDNIKEVNKYAIELANYYDSIVFSEEDTKTAKKEMAEINKFKDKVSRFRIDIEKKWREPLEVFTNTAKETEKLLKNTYDSISIQIKNYEDKIKEEKKQEVEDYFKELCSVKEIDFVNFEQININVTLSASLKSLKEEVDEFVDKIADDINLISTQAYVDEITVEYKKHLNVSKAITDVTNRHIELEKIEKDKQEKAEQKLNDEAMLDKIDSLSAPKIEAKEELVTATFKATCTKDKMKKLVEFMRNEEIEYEQCK